jgi:hypothetical protein
MDYERGKAYTHEKVHKICSNFHSTCTLCWKGGVPCPFGALSKSAIAYLTNNFYSAKKGLDVKYLYKVAYSVIWPKKKKKSNKDIQVCVITAMKKSKDTRICQVVNTLSFGAYFSLVVYNLTEWFRGSYFYRSYYLISLKKNHRVIQSMLL